MSLNKEEIYARAQEVFGCKAQLLVAAEESAELSAAVSRMLNGKADLEEVVLEMADVMIAIEQISYIFDLDEDIEKAKEKKLRRKAKKHSRRSFEQDNRD